MEKTKQNPSSPDVPLVSRRQVLAGFGSAATWGLFSMSPLITGAVAKAGASSISITIERFLSLSAFLMEAEQLDRVDVLVGTKLYQAFSRLDAFTKHAPDLYDLSARIRKEYPRPEVRHLKSLPEFTEPLQRLSQMILRGWYIGVAGEGDQNHLVTYEYARMFNPTQGITVIPTYCPGEPGFWAAPPRINLQPEDERHE